MKDCCSRVLLGYLRSVVLFFRMCHFAVKVRRSVAKEGYARFATRCRKHWRSHETVEKRDQKAVVKLAKWLFTLSSRFHVGPTCLTVAYVLYRFLGEAGAKPILCIGVRRTDSGIQSHAWVEVENEQILHADNPKDLYKVLVEIGDINYG